MDHCRDTIGMVGLSVYVGIMKTCKTCVHKIPGEIIKTIIRCKKILECSLFLKHIVLDRSGGMKIDDPDFHCGYHAEGNALKKDD